MSMDVRKELIGNFYRDGKLYTQEQIKVNDHDFRSAVDGIAVPHGLYDVARKIGYLMIGTSHDTSEFACACLELWWLTYGRFDYPQATEILLLFDHYRLNRLCYYPRQTLCHQTQSRRPFQAVHDHCL
ncbi:MAG: ISAzo13-like element transposase-related protein [Caldilineaceae bacterium]|jgi:hypothetical protein